MSDLVKRLRIPWDGMGNMANAERAEAADEIERLRQIVAEYDRVRVEYLAAWAAWVKDHSGDDIAEWLRIYASAHPADNPDQNAVEFIHRSIDKRCREAADEIERLRAERDEARRDLCHADEGWPFSDAVARIKAAERGWDCFKDDDANCRGILGSSNSAQEMGRDCSKEQREANAANAEFRKGTIND
jgi:hypothetical protein